LPVVDTFLKAQAHLKDPGLDLAVRELLAVLEDEGVKRITTVGKSFDPHIMECVEVVEGKDDVVVEEVAPGYRLHDKLLRVAHVKVGKKI
jgi:molecular chaperone GrpE